MPKRPLIAIPGRFAAQTSALRYGAVVTARALSAAVLRAGGEPVTVHPWAPDGVVSADEVAERLAFADGVLLPGGGDLDPRSYGAEIESEHVYDVDVEQDAFDLAVARSTLDSGTPLLAICRGLHVVTVARGGTLEQHMNSPHRHLQHTVTIEPGTRLATTMGTSVVASCYHHQRVDRVGDGMTIIARADDGTVEGIDIPDSRGLFLAVQWHPEDTAANDPSQQALFDALVAAAR